MRGFFGFMVFLLKLFSFSINKVNPIILFFNPLSQLNAFQFCLFVKSDIK